MELVLLITLALGCVVQATEVRLNGSSYDNGRVEVKDNGLWVAISGTRLRRSEIAVICRSAGLPWSNTMYKSYFPDDRGTYKVLNIKCQGNETNIDRCTRYGVTKWAQTNIVVSCKELEFRLQYGSENHGIVEVKDNHMHFDLWRPICTQTLFDRDWATVMCKKLGRNSSHALNVDAGRYYKSPQDALRLEMNCDGEEDKANCSVERVFDASLCNKFTLALQRAAVLCSDSPLEYRLTAGKTNRTGRFEVFVNNTWGPVCPSYFSSSEAVVACNSLGLPSTDASYILGKYSGGTSVPSIGKFVSCRGNETSMDECVFVMWAPASCAENEQYVGISCGEAHEDQLRLTGGYDEISGRVEVYQNGSWGSFCYSGFDSSAIAVLCNNVCPSPIKVSRLVSSYSFGFGLGRLVVENITCFGNETRLLDCPHTLSGRKLNVTCWDSAAVTCGYGDEQLRITEEGLLEIRHNKEWGTICSKSFKDVEASVACKTLNRPSSFAQRKYSPSGGIRSGRMWAEGMHCRGTEDSLLDCAFTKWGPVSCSHENDVVISCQDINTVPINYAMRGEPLVHVGYVLMQIDGQWGSVCDDGFGEKEAQVACRSMGRRTDGARMISNTDSLFKQMTIFSSGTKIWLDDVKCEGTEASLMDCQHNYIGENDCSAATEAVVVYCGPPDDDDYAVRLVGSSDPNSGRVEMKMYGQWGTVCKDRVTNVEEVVCRQLGLPSSRATTTTKYGGGTGLTWMDRIICYTYQSSLAVCSHSLAYSWYQCTHSDDLGVECKDFPVGAIVGIVIGCVGLIIFFLSMIAFALGRQRLRNGVAATAPVQYIVPSNGSIGQHQTPKNNAAMFSPPPAYSEVVLTVPSKSAGQDNPASTAKE